MRTTIYQKCKQAVAAAAIRNCVSAAPALILTAWVWLSALSPVALRAQVLARPGWAGSGVAVEPWWHRAVFYRIDVARFQDGTGAGCGDLAGIVQRVDYLQSLGVDAIILAPGFDRATGDPPASLQPGSGQPGSQSRLERPISASVSHGAAGPCGAAPSAGSSRSSNSPDGPETMDSLDELARQAASHHLRVLVELDAPTSQSSEAMGRYLAQVRSWLNQGAAGLYLRTQQLAALKDPNLAAYLVRQLRSLTRSVPGERILLADEASDPGGALGKTVAHEALLTTGAALSFTTPTAASLRQQMLARLGSSSLTTVLRASPQTSASLSAAQRDSLDRTAAAMLLASRSAVLIDYGQELGEQQAGPSAVRQASSGETDFASANSPGSLPLMQWTPTNLTRDPKPASVESAASNPDAGYGTFHPYVKPLPRTLFPPPQLPDVVLSNTPPPVDPNTLPGFSSGEIDPALAASAAVNGSTANVAVEDADPNSLLNLYRRLIQLHHENASVRNGSEDVLNYDGMGALVWLRRAPVGSRTSATVVIACNLSAQPLALPIEGLGALPARRSSVRNLLSVASSSLPGQSLSQQAVARAASESLIVSPGQLFVGELHP